MERIWIIGASGCGKTTLGKILAEKLETDATDLDELNWLPGWQTVSVEELTWMVDAVTSEKQWVISGNYSSQEKFMSRADTIIWLDYPFSTVLSRLMKRTFRRIYYKELCCNGNREALNKLFTRDSIILWLFRTYRKRKQKGYEIMNAPNHSHLRIHHFTKPNQTNDWLNSLPQYLVDLSDK
jgi:adenylate kinase family enzyme